MCQIFVRHSKNTSIPANVINAAWRYNNDSWGIMRVEAGTTEILVDRGLTREGMLSAMEQYEEMDGILVLHLRAGAGAVLHNAHPFKCTNEVFMCHNGYINIEITKKGFSDTYHYAKYRLKQMIGSRPEQLDDPHFIDYIARDIGRNNRIVLLRNDGKTFIVNEDTGVNWKGLWLANNCGIPFDSYDEKTKAFLMGGGEKKTTALVPTTPILPIKMGGDPLFIGYLVRTPEYFDLAPNAAMIFFNMNKKISNGVIFSAQETRYWHSIRDQVKRNITRLNIPPNTVKAWCTGLVNIFLMEQTPENREKIEGVTHLLTAPVPDEPAKPIVKRSRGIIIDVNGYLHQCTECKKLVSTKDMWFTDEQYRTPVGDGRVGTCDECYKKELPPVTTIPTTYSSTPYKQYVQTIEWHCSECNGNGYTKGSWTSGTEEKPVCYTCDSKHKKEEEKQVLIKSAKFCGVTDSNNMTEFEIKFWSKQDFMKDVIKPVEVHVNAS